MSFIRTLGIAPYRAEDPGDSSSSSSSSSDDSSSSSSSSSDDSTAFTDCITDTDFWTGGDIPYDT